MTIGTLIAYLGIDQDQFDRGLDKAKGKLSTLNSVAAGVGKTLLAVGGGIAGIGTAVGAVGGLVGLLSTVAGALPVLAAGAVAAKFGMVGLGLAMDGFGDAMSAVDDPAAFAEAIKDLAPAAQETAKAVRGLKPAWDEMKGSLQEQLFSGLSEQVSELGERYIPLLGASFGQIATGANLAARGIGETLSTGRRIADVRSMTDAFALSWTDVLAAAQPLVSVLLDVGTVASQVLPGLTAGAGGAAQAFADMVARMRETGELKQMMVNGLDALGKLGQVAGNVGEILGGIFRAADQGGAPFLERLVLITQRIADMVNSVDGQEALGTFFATAATLSGLFMDALSALLPVLPPLLDTLSQLAITIGTALVGALTFLAPYLEAFATWAAENPGLVLGVAIAFGALLAAANLLMGIVGIMQMVAAVTASGLLGMIASAVTAAASWVGSWLVMAASALASAASMALSWLVAIAPIALVIAAIVGIVALIIYNWDAIAQFTAEAWANVTAFVTDAWNNVTGAVSAGIAGAVGFVTDGWNNAVQFTRQAWANLVSAVQAGGNNALNFVRSIPGMILNALSGLGSLLAGSGRALVDGFLNGIKGAWNAVVGFVQQGVQWVRDLFPFSPAKTGPFSGSGYVTHSGKALTGDFAESLRDGMPGVIASARELMAAAHVEMAPPQIGRAPAATGLPGDAWMSGGVATPAARSGDKQVITTVNIHNPKAERGSDSFARDMADLSEMGAFAL